MSYGPAPDPFGNFTLGSACISCADARTSASSWYQDYAGRRNPPSSKLDAAEAGSMVSGSATGKSASPQSRGCLNCQTMGS